MPSKVAWRSWRSARPRSPGSRTPMTSDFEALERTLINRRSCRGYTDAQVPRDVIEQVLSAAQRTASWCNTQPWHVVITSGDATVKLRDALLSSTGGGPD